MKAVRGPRCAVSHQNLPGMKGAEVVRLRDDARGMELTVVPAEGGEIGSMRVRLRRRWHEILYRALDYKSSPPDGWRGRAPLLWPAVGRSFTPEQIAGWRATGRKPRSSRFRSGGREYPVGIHGFARDAAWRLDDAGADRDSAWARCSLASSRETRRRYPFEFEVSVTHSLRKGAIVSRYEVTAGTNPKPMPFCIGNHVSFRLPLTGKGEFGACAIRTPARRRLLLSELALLSGRSRKVDASTHTPLADGKFLNAVLGGLRRGNAWAELIDPNGLTLRISQTERRVAGTLRLPEKELFFVFWGTSEHGYFCPEPWVGRPNALNTGRGLVRLPPGKRFVWEMRIQPRAV